MPVYDYRCALCDYRLTDEFYTTWKKAPRVLVCPQCHRETLKQDWAGARNFIHMSHSSMYGKPQPALGGEVLQDYAHKKRLMREWDAEESNDPVKGSRCYQKEKPPPSPHQAVWLDANVDTTDSL